MKIPAGLIIVLAIAIGAISLTTNCLAEGRTLALANGNTAPMKCYWSAMAEIATIIPLIAVGAMLAFSKRKETRRTLTIMAGVLSGIVMLIPTVLIGVCAMPSHQCNSIMLPTTLFAGTLMLALSVGTLILSERRAEPVIA